MTIKIEIHEKTKEQYKLEPNLKDYDKTYADFKWGDICNEIEWFEDGKLNAAYNAIDRHLKSDKKNKVALHWISDKEGEKTFTFEDLAKESNKFGNLLKKLGVKKGDRVFLFLPRVPEEYIAFLGTLKIGAIAGTLFQAFKESALLDRLENSGASILLTNSEMKERLSGIRDKLPELRHIIVADGVNVDASKGDINYIEEMKSASDELEIEKTDAEDNAFMLYTSGTTGKPKGIMHVHKAIIEEHKTAKWVLDLHDEDIYWCTADPGWVTGVAYGILGIWSVGATSIVHDGRFNPEKWYEILQDKKVSVWYTAPTAIRMLMKAGDELVNKFKYPALRHMLSVGEPLNPEAIRWGKKVFGLTFHDTWWQTETGAMMIVNYSSLPVRLGSMGKPTPGIVAGIIDDKGNELPPNTEGKLALKRGWPSMMRGIWKNQARYDKCFIGDWYVSGDNAFVDEDGYFWFIGREDDVIKTAGERVGPFEVESALIDHKAVIEAGVIGKPDPDRGQIIKAFVVLAEGYKPTDELKKEIQQFVKANYAGHAYPRELEFVESLPKTRSGKIMRRVLKAKELGMPIGDVSTIED